MATAAHQSSKVNGRDDNEQSNATGDNCNSQPQLSPMTTTSATAPVYQKDDYDDVDDEKQYVDDESARNEAFTDGRRQH